MRAENIVAILEPREDVASQYVALTTPETPEEEAADETVVADVEPVAAEEAEATVAG